MTRRELRENAFKILFRLEFHAKEEMAEQIELYTEELPKLKDEERAYLKDKCSGILNHIDELDEKINKASKGWKTTRMGKVDLALLRLAVYEIGYEEEIPVKVSINEAVELAKQYGTDNSSGFVNGILSNFV
jgi:N utilization substance protein B